ncbi:MAG: 50S ribosomal protein L11 methyltransferase [Cellulosilyticaceae bacterium]
MDYIQVSIETTREAVEALSYFLIEEQAGGVEIEDPQDVWNQDKKEVIYDLIDESLLQEDMDKVFVKAYFSTEINLAKKLEAIEMHLQGIKNYLNIGSGKITLVDMPEEMWANEWKKYYKPVALGERIVIKPSWENYDVKENELIIEMDPGMAFGTGTHETTAMCAGLVEKYIKPDDNVIDIGTGSGILGIIAAKMGAKDVLGVDIDLVAVKVAKENVKLNNVDQVMDVKAGNLIDVVETRATIVVSNIIADVIIMLAEQVDKVIAEDGIWIASGIINSRKLEVLEALKKNGWIVIEECEQKEWVALVCKRDEKHA